MDQIDPVELLGVTFEDDDPQVDTRLRPLWRLGKFQDPRTEQLYCKWHHQLWLPRYTAMLILSTVIFNGSFVISFSPQDVAVPDPSNPFCGQSDRTWLTS